MPFRAGDVLEPRVPIELGTYDASITNAENTVAGTGTEGWAVEYELQVEGEPRTWRESVYAAGMATQILVAADILRWVKKADSDFDDTKLAEFNASRQQPAKAYLIDAETESVLSGDLPPPETLIGKKLRVRLGDRRNSQTGDTRRQIIAWMPSEQ